MMLVALNRHSGLLRIILQARRFRINVLSADQQEIATWFASERSPNRFIGPRWKYDDGLPLFLMRRHGSPVPWVRCSKEATTSSCSATSRTQPLNRNRLLSAYARTFGTYSPWNRGQVSDNTGLPRPRRPAKQDVTDDRELQSDGSGTRQAGP